MRILFLADQRLERQTFIARSVDALLRSGDDVKVALTADQLPLPDEHTVACCGARKIESPANYFRYVALKAVSAFSGDKGAYIGSYVDWRKAGRKTGAAVAWPWFGLLRYLSKWQPDLIHVHFAWNVPLALPIARYFGIPVVCTVHGSDIYLRDEWSALLSSPEVRRIVCVSSSMKRYIDERSESLKQKTIHVLNPIDDVFLEKAMPAPSSMRIIMVAALRTLKNHEWLLRSLRELQDRGRDFECLLVGDVFRQEPQTPTQIRALLEELSLQEHVQFLGWQPAEAVKRELDCSTVLVLPSRSEGMPICVVEAMARERVPVTTDLPGTREATGEGRFGILVPLDDVKALANALIRGHEETLQRGPMAREGRTFVQQNLHPDVHAHALQAVYAAAVNDRQ